MHSSPGPQSILLVGPPNSGKTTLFNWITHSRFRAVNYPGSTVDCFRGLSHPSYGRIVNVVDSPGIYGLNAESSDEAITVELLRFDPKMGDLRAAIVCVDSTQLERHLPLVLKLQHLGWPLVVALTMPDLSQRSGQVVDRLALQNILKVPVIEVDGRTGAGVTEVMAQVSRLRPLTNEDKEAGLKKPELDPLEVSKTVSGWLKDIRHSQKAGLTPQMITARIDQWLLHPIGGAIGFVVAMVLIFTAVFWLADPLMSGVDAGFSWLAEYLRVLLPEGIWNDFVVNGIVSSFAAVLVFTPQILILFFLMSLLEDSGYLARAATLVDRPLSFFGLSGRAFVPLLSGYACAVPAIMAVRTIRSTRERWLAISVIPLLSCSARLPVYALLLAYLFQGEPAWKAGLALTSLYLGSAFVGVSAAGILNRILKEKHPSSFLMELPLYRRPQLRLAVRYALTRTQAYIRRAGPVIFTLALVLWAGTNFPSPEPDQNFLAQVGQAVEPVFRPMGVDWRVGAALLSAFAAREVFVSALALVFGVEGGDDDVGIRQSIVNQMHEAHSSDGALIFTSSSVLGLILFFMIALQCSSTVAIAARETGSWRFALSQLLVLNGVAYLVAVGAVQTARLLGVQ